MRPETTKWRREIRPRCSNHRPRGCPYHLSSLPGVPSKRVVSSQLHLYMRALLVRREGKVEAESSRKSSQLNMPCMMLVGKILSVQTDIFDLYCVYLLTTGAGADTGMTNRTPRRILLRQRNGFLGSSCHHLCPPWSLIRPLLLFIRTNLLSGGRSLLLAMNVVPGRFAVMASIQVCCCGALGMIPVAYHPIVCGPCTLRTDQGAQCVYTGELEKKRAMQK